MQLRQQPQLRARGKSCREDGLASRDPCSQHNSICDTVAFCRDVTLSSSPGTHLTAPFGDLQPEMLPEACVSHCPVCHAEVSGVDSCKWILILETLAAEHCQVLISSLFTPHLLSVFSLPTRVAVLVLSPQGGCRLQANTVVSRGRQSLFTHQSPSLAQG